ncbi:CU044_2847 family protein [Frankia sp. Cj3]|uniref:CU044_2847 family protein n=1 Tax=Frankia sp. Cj3 TaxID=2880976 RepID=UPI001EF435CA|nr:CU044_2847 family protein [Frankia sp. Cj3]
MVAVEFPLEDGGVVLVQVTDEPGAVVTRGGPGGPETIERAERTFDAALATIRTVAQTVLRQLQPLTRYPDEITVTFGLELTAKSGALLAAAGATAQLQVGLTWRPQTAAPGQLGSAGVDVSRVERETESD